MSFFSELKQRKVFRVAAGYVVAAWIAIQAASIALPAFEAPSWVLRVFILMFLLGFPLALLLSWAVDVTSDGITTSPRSRSDKAMGVLVLILMAAAAGWYLWRPIQIPAPQPVVGTSAAKPPTPLATAATQSAATPASPPPPAAPLPAAVATSAASVPVPTSVKPAQATPSPAMHPRAADRPVAASDADTDADAKAEAHALRERRRLNHADGEHAGLSPRCREILQQARAEMDSGERTRPELRRERFAAQAQLRDASCLEGMRQAEPGARFVRH